MDLYKLKVIITSTREQRGGISVANWFVERVKKYEGFETEVLDLMEINLPMVHEPNHPKLGKYMYDHTKEWSRKIDEADAFIFIMPEYNYGMPPAMLNAIDYLMREWMYKPAGLVSYGGISGGLRSAQMSKQVLTTVKVMPMSEGVAIPFFTKYINEDGVFEPIESVLNSYQILMDELMRWTKGLHYLRNHFLDQK
ncbi:MAG: NAD(P)H-dependent oxidoreductase [Chitinophagaceae bacterium]|nr:NAD(P)H-dependent oxidoreductase [Chitinophagaceae bacterium]MCZ2395428.1 NAD(P)H-dependent oxidoreductase [Chitinophagales bacterium]